MRIDQENVHERNLQVSMIGQIYRDATSVLAWLGYDGDAYVQATLNDLCQHRYGKNDLASYDLHKMHVQAFEGEQILVDLDHGLGAGLHYLCTKLWFSHGWVSATNPLKSLYILSWLHSGRM
jgi:hypothetical protein